MRNSTFNPTCSGRCFVHCANYLTLSDKKSKKKILHITRNYTFSKLSRQMFLLGLRIRSVCLARISMTFEPTRVHKLVGVARASCHNVGNNFAKVLAPQTKMLMLSPWFSRLHPFKEYKTNGNY